ncbi:hypothetical protein [Paracraurococcus lichenis]|uniref:Uncharacterized protein n=1 Tax=Paracraurococcus lichenis TaxID=3064888 RepID=A0ABT9E9V7_9PROT|nr:hypothetical protein [Paracraurococcus sp. LOR1-02]MDO9712889.1 hypothetical protein [Paracraurococcus sp. LOR1-02]
MNQLFPNPQAAAAGVERIRRTLQPLGPDGYDVLPGSILSSLETSSVETLRE